MDGATTTGLVDYVVSVAAGLMVGKAQGTYSRQLTLRATMTPTGTCSGTPTYSGTETFNFVLPKLCVIGSVTGINFGDVPQGTPSADIMAQGSVSVTCPNGTPYTIYLGNGLNRISGGYRQMMNGTTPMMYQLYQDGGLNKIWDETGGPTVKGGSGGFSTTATGAAIVSPIYGVIPKGIPLPSTLGPYTDTVVVTVAY
jgi:spore coat protein U-like protein